jgi:hypothetical protein
VEEGLELGSFFEGIKDQGIWPGIYEVVANTDIVTEIFLGDYSIFSDDLLVQERK